MKKRQKQEREKLSSKLDEESYAEERNLKKELDSEQEKLIREKKNRQATELAARTDLSDEQLRAVSIHV